MGKNRTEDEMFGGLGEVLDIDSDYQRIPSEIAERLSKIVNADGQEYEIARDNLLSLMKVGGEALSDLHSLALQAQHPRSFEVLTQLLKVMMDSQKQLLEIKAIEEKTKADGKVIDGKANVTNVLNCTPAQLSEMIRNAKKND